MTDIDGTTGPDMLTGTSGNDYYYWSGGNDSMDGGGGRDTLVETSGIANALYDLGGGFARIGSNTLLLTSIENVETFGNDADIEGTSQGNYIGVGGQRVTAYGHGGNDTIEASGDLGDADNFFYGGADDDTFYVLSGGTVSVSGGAGTRDRLHIPGSIFDGSWHGDFTASGLILTRGNTAIMAGPDVEQFLFEEDYHPGGTSQIVQSYGEMASYVTSYQESLVAQGWEGTPGPDTLTGTSDDNVFSWSGGNDTIDGGAGVDRLELGYSASSLLVDLPAGTITIDTNILSVSNVEGVSVDGNATHFIGDDADNYFRAFSANATMTGGAGDDNLIWESSETGAGILAGGAGDDLIEIYGSATARVSGGDGVDRVVVFASLTGSIPTTVSLQSDGGLTIESSYANVSIAADVEKISFYFDTGPSGIQTFDFAEVAARALRVQDGTEGNDVLTGGGLRDELNGLGGNDWLLPGVGRDTIDGGAGVDMLSYAGLGGPVKVYLQSGFSHKFGTNHAYAGSDTFSNIEGVTGTAYNDYLRGFDGVDFLRGGGGNDTLAGSDGADVFDGGSGRDRADYSLGVVVGEAGTGINASLLRGRGWAGDAAGDRYSGIEDLKGSILGDHLAGDHGANRLYGMHGDDTLIGLGGDDYIYGGIGTDTAQFSYDRDQYTVTTNGAVTTVAYTAGGGDGTDTLLSVEQLQFADELVIL